jgi:hypothetical protein
MTKTVLRDDQSLESFPADLALLLVEFGKYIAKLDVDYIVIMARKALRLYDLLLLAGGPRARVPVLTNHVLDQNLEVFRGKRIALVDDTLILGTTLGEAERRLKDVGARVTSHVFAIDTENWCKDLISPEKSFAGLDHNAIRSFCAVEVNALATVGIPYLTDFPVSEKFKFRRAQLISLHGLSGWNAYSLTTPSQVSSGVAVYTLLPTQDTEDVFRTVFGETVAELIEIAKVRVFCRQTQSGYSALLVPIVTLGAIGERDITRLFRHFLDRLEGKRRRSLDKLQAHLSTPLAQLRFIQYVVSLAIGNICLTEVAEAVQSPRPIPFALTEAVRLFGPWLQVEFQFTHTRVPIAFAKQLRSKEPAYRLRLAKLPELVFDKSKSEFDEFVRPPSGIPEEMALTSPGHFVDLTRAFIGLHTKYEIPARQEAHRLGERLFTASAEDAPYRDRLKFGFAWRPLAEILLKRDGMRMTLRRSNRTSLLLDHLIDMGIAVPILCQRDGVLFRAYRYGEDVEFGNQEFALAYELIGAFLESSKSPNVTKVVLEKLLASLLHVGVAKKFLKTVQYGLSGVDGIARVGFHLHGAVVSMPKYDTIYAEEQNTWLSRYMVQLQALRYDRNSDKPYSLGRLPEAAYPDPSALNEVRQLGRLLGKLIAADDKADESILRPTDLIVLTSCSQPRHALAAIAAELRILTDWYVRSKADITRNVNFTAPENRQAYTLLTRGVGHLALRSARIKIEGYRQGRAQQIVATCSKFLKRQVNGDFLAEQWDSDWTPVLSASSQEQRDRFDPLFATFTTDILCFAASLYLMELAIASLPSVARRGHVDPTFLEACGQAGTYVRALRPHADLDDLQTELVDHVAAIAGKRVPLAEPQLSFDRGAQWLAQNHARLRAATKQVEAAINDFGRNERRVQFHSVVWYDIIDSRGDKSGLKGSALTEYRDRVRAFKDTIADDLTGLMNQALSMRATVLPSHGTLRSKNDEKHIFMAGAQGSELQSQAIKMLLMRAHSHRICVRIIAIKCDFAGEAGVNKLETDAEPEGEAFWEHFKVLKEQMKSIETKLGVNPLGRVPRRSTFWAAGEFIGKIKLPKTIVSQRSEHTITTEIENAQFATSISGGPCTWPAG